jgi:hypothetical protein
VKISTSRGISAAGIEDPMLRKGEVKKIATPRFVSFTVSGLVHQVTV